MEFCSKPARFCFRLGYWAGLVAVTLSAAEPPTQPQRIRSVVKTDARTGKLVRSVIVAPKPVALTLELRKPDTSGPAVSGVLKVLETPRETTPLDAAVEKIAAEHSLPPELIHSVIKVESNYNRYAVSPKGASGYMQLIPSTARRFGVADVFDTVENIQAGAKYLKYLLDLYKGDYPRALAAYNAGEGAVAKYNGIPPYPETQNYVIQVKKRLDRANQISAAKLKEKDEKAAQLKPEQPSHIEAVLEADGTVRYIAR
jgi:soluble lytic murein transglycosylase-like protein